MARPQLITIFFHWFLFVVHGALGKNLICLRGSYLSGSRCVLCPGGTYGSRPGLTTEQCSGPCDPGFFCPPGSTSAIEKACGSTTYYCPRGSAMRLRVNDGYYTATFPFHDTAAAQVNAAESQIQCEPGFYCINGIRRKCPAGTYGITSGLQTVACSGPCPKGSFCPEGTSDPLPCPAGTYGSEMALASTSCTDLCPIGHYCETGTVTPQPCPPGTFGGGRGLTTKRCSSKCSETMCQLSPCPAGFYCPLATTQPIPCGDVSVFCPTGSPTPTTVSLGFYTIWSPASGTTKTLGRLENGYVEGGALAVLNQTTRIDQRQCEPGTYCMSGVKRWCPAGVYGDIAGLPTAQCTGPCPAGYHCPIGTGDFYRFPCVERTSFCRQGSLLPSPVAVGYYTITASTGDIRIDEKMCPKGSYCTGGVKYLCPAGTYGSTTGLATPACSGRCQDGYICPAGSVSVTQTPCPAGQYSRNGVACAPCLAGYLCAAGSPDLMQNVCGSDTTYCPRGSSSPMNVASGFYAVGQTPSTHTAQALCVVQNVYHLPQCPTRTVGVNSGL